jgi:hypothetical protein
VMECFWRTSMILVIIFACFVRKCLRANGYGKNDPFFTVEGAKAYQRDLPKS